MTQYYNDILTLHHRVFFIFKCVLCKKKRYNACIEFIKIKIDIHKSFHRKNHKIMYFKDDLSFSLIHFCVKEKNGHFSHNTYSSEI